MQKQLKVQCTNATDFGANAGAADSVLLGESQRHFRQQTDRATSPIQHSAEACRPLADSFRVAVNGVIQQADHAMTGKGFPLSAPPFLHPLKGFIPCPQPSPACALTMMQDPHCLFGGEELEHISGFCRIGLPHDTNGEVFWHRSDRPDVKALRTGLRCTVF